jgi:K+:H+ antiporter
VEAGLGVSGRPDRKGPPPLARRLLAFYGVGIVVVGIVTAIAVAAGQDRAPEREIAGGYALTREDRCLGRGFNVEQSGRFVEVKGVGRDAGGELELDGDRLSGEVTCSGDERPLDARVRGTRIAGNLDGRRIAADLTRDPPEPGSLEPRTPGSLEGEYHLSPRSSCLGGELTVEGGGRVELLAHGERKVGEGRYARGRLVGEVECAEGPDMRLAGEASNRSIVLTLVPEGARTVGDGAPPEGSERLTADKRREAGSRFAAFFIAVAVTMVVARLFGMGAAALHQPRVMGEVLAGIALGPTLLGALAPGVQAWVFPEDIVPTLGVVAQLGLIFYMFLIGLEVDPDQLRGRIRQIAAISNASVALPMILGIAVALPIYERVGPDKKFLAFAVFMGVSMSITAFPVLARVLVERRMLKRPVGALTLAAAAIDDVTAWLLIALATAIAAAGSASEVLITIALAVVFCAFMGAAVRPLLNRASTAYDEAGRVPGGWIVLIFTGVLLSAFATEEIGVALVFGGFVMGLVMPRHAGLTEDVTRRVEDFVVILLLPLFFVFTGLRTDLGLLARPELIALTLALLGVAVFGKVFGAAMAARVTGLDWRSSAVVGTLMNTRGLTELIVLNLALEQGVISEALFAMLVLMALITTLMTTPMMNVLDPTNELGAPVEEELELAREVSAAEFPALVPPQKSILVAPQTNAALEQLASLSAPLARSEPPRELILARLVTPPRGAAVRGGLQTENRLLEEATKELNEKREELARQGIAVRSVAFISLDSGQDLSRLAQGEDVDLVLIDGRRPLLGEGVPRGEVGEVLRDAPCDVAVLVAKEDERVLPDEGAAVIVPFGGAEHDWAALELGAWISSATAAPLKLLGAAGETEERTRVTRLLGDAGLLVQQYAGVQAQPVVAELGREGVIEAAAEAGLLVVGLSERWREEGLGPTRSEIARAAPAPVLFVRRGTRPGALAPKGDVTRFTWSAAGMGARITPGSPIS